MSGTHRRWVAALIASGVLLAALLVAVAANACPAESSVQRCPDAARNRVAVVTLAATSASVLVAPFAFLAEVMARRRIVYRGAWLRAARRGVLTGLVIATLAGLRLGGALSVPAAMFVVILAGITEWVVARREP